MLCTCNAYKSSRSELNRRNSQCLHLQDLDVLQDDISWITEDRRRNASTPTEQTWTPKTQMVSQPNIKPTSTYIIQLSKANMHLEANDINTIHDKPIYDDNEDDKTTRMRGIHVPYSLAMCKKSKEKKKRTRNEYQYHVISQERKGEEEEDKRRRKGKHFKGNSSLNSRPFLC